VVSPFSNVVRKKLTDIFQDKTVWTHAKKLQIGSGILKLWAVKVSGASFFSPNQIKSSMTLIMVDKPQPSYNLLNVMK